MFQDLEDYENAEEFRSSLVAYAQSHTSLLLVVKKSGECTETIGDRMCYLAENVHIMKITVRVYSVALCCTFYTANIRWDRGNDCSDHCNGGGSAHCTGDRP